MGCAHAPAEHTQSSSPSSSVIACLAPCGIKPDARLGLREWKGKVLMLLASERHLLQHTNIGLASTLQFLLLFLRGTVAVKQNAGVTVSTGPMRLQFTADLQTDAQPTMLPNGQAH